jgi:GTP-binding protein
MNGPDSTPIKGRINQVLNFKGLERVLVDEAVAGDIVLINGIEEIGIGSTVCAPDTPEALPMLTVDEPTLTMNFMVNNSPLAGREGKFVTSRQLRDRLDRELKANVALRVAPTDDDTIFEVSGRGELHLTILIENMRREGFELAVSRPRVVFKMVDGVRHEPFENLSVDVEEVNQGGVMEELGRRRGDLQNMESDGKGRVRLEYRIPARGLIGFQGEFMTLTRGTGLMSHVFDAYAPVDNTRGEMAGRRNGVLISQDDGAAVAYAIWKLQDRGRMFVSHNDPVYEGMIIGIHSRDNDLVVNPIKGKQLTNVRSSGTDEAVRLVPPIQMSLEYAVEFIEDDELVEITPKSIRLRKRYLKEHERKKAAAKRNEDVCRAEAHFIELVASLHPDAEGKPALIGNCQAGWQIMMTAALRPDITGPVMLAGAPLSYWAACAAAVRCATWADCWAAPGSPRCRATWATASSTAPTWCTTSK